ALLHLARRHRRPQLFATPSGQQITQLSACRDVSIPGPVPKLGPRLDLSISTGDRIGKSVAVWLHNVRNRVLEGRPALRGQLVLGNRAAPYDVADISWSDLRKEEASSGRIDPVCADKNITPFRTPARKVHCQTKGTLLKPGQLFTPMISVLIKVLQHSS